MNGMMERVNMNVMNAQLFIVVAVFFVIWQKMVIMILKGHNLRMRMKRKRKKIII